MVDAAPEPEATPFGLNPFAPGFYEDPYVQYAALRDETPVHRSMDSLWVLTRWTDCHHVLREPGTSVEERNAALSRRADLIARLAPDRDERGRRSILGLDPPDHARIRRLVSKAFTPRTVARLEPRIVELVDQLLDDAEAGIGSDGTIDLIPTLAFPLPFQVIHEMLGMPDSIDVAELRSVSQTITQSLDPILAAQHLDEILVASDRIREIVLDVIEWKRDNPGDDLLTGLLAAEDQGHVLSDEEILDNVILLYLAGHETTVNLIGNGTLALLRHPDQADRLRADPDLDANAIEELLRYDSPVQFSRRITLEPFNVADVTFAPGDSIMTALGAANRDPAKFGPTADQVDIGRADANHHISFGSGVHHCLGAALARLEGRVTIPRLLRRYPDLALAVDEPPPNGRMVLRGRAELPVTV